MATRRVGAEAEGTESAEHDRGRERRPSESPFLSLLSSLSSLDGRVQYFSACTAAGRRARSFDNGIAFPGPSVFRAKHRSLAVLVSLTCIRSGCPGSNSTIERRRTCTASGAGPRGPVAPISAQIDPGKHAVMELAGSSQRGTGRDLYTGVTPRQQFVSRNSRCESSRDKRQCLLESTKVYFQEET